MDIEEYKNNLLKTGFVKSTISTTLISIGVYLLITTINTIPLNYESAGLSLVIIAMGYVGYYLGDLQKVKHKEAEYKLIEDTVKQWYDEKQNELQQKINEELLTALQSGRIKSNQNKESDDNQDSVENGADGA